MADRTALSALDVGGAAAPVNTGGDGACAAVESLESQLSQDVCRERQGGCVSRSERMACMHQAPRILL